MKINKAVAVKKKMSPLQSHSKPPLADSLTGFFGVFPGTAAAYKNEKERRMSELLKSIGYVFMGSGIAAWVFMIWAVKLVLQNRLSIHISPKKKEEE